MFLETRACGPGFLRPFWKVKVTQKLNFPMSIFFHIEVPISAKIDLNWWNLHIPLDKSHPRSILIVEGYSVHIRFLRENIFKSIELQVLITYYTKQHYVNDFRQWSLKVILERSRSLGTYTLYCKKKIIFSIF
jgi:hypothetical protein